MPVAASSTPRMMGVMALVTKTDMPMLPVGTTTEVVDHVQWLAAQ